MGCHGRRNVAWDADKMQNMKCRSERKMGEQARRGQVIKDLTGTTHRLKSSSKGISEVPNAWWG